jgi:hypothetical protein
MQQDHLGKDMSSAINPEKQPMLSTHLPIYKAKAKTEDQRLTEQVIRQMDILLRRSRDTEHHHQIRDYTKAGICALEEHGSRCVFFSLVPTADKEN